MTKPAKQATAKGGEVVSPRPAEPNLPDLSKAPYPDLVAIWTAQGQVLCPVCGYQTHETKGCLWDPSHKEQA